MNFNDLPNEINVSEDLRDQIGDSSLLNDLAGTSILLHIARDKEAKEKGEGFPPFMFHESFNLATIFFSEELEGERWFLSTIAETSEAVVNSMIDPDCDFDCENCNKYKKEEEIPEDELGEYILKKLRENVPPDTAYLN